MFDYNLFYDEISVQPNDLFRQKKLVKILDKFEGQKIIIMRSNCHKKTRSRFSILYNWSKMDWSYTCTCGDHVEMILF